AISVVAKDPGLTNLSGGVIKFNAPASGASATLNPANVTLSASNTGQTVATAKFLAGTYSVTATAGGATTAGTFSLTNTPFTGYVVTTASDVVNAADGVISLREAITAANGLGSPAPITFDPSLSGQTISLTTVGDGTFGPSGLLVTGQPVIDGGSNHITISA